MGGAGVGGVDWGGGGSVGWMAQFAPGARTDIVCRKDGTMRKMEPQIG